MKVLILHRPTGPTGGDVIAAKEYGAALEGLGVEALCRPVTDLQFTPLAAFDWVHIWSANSPSWALPAAAHIKQHKTRLIMTPNWWSRRKRLDYYGYHEKDVAPGYTEQVARTLSLADVLFCCTMSEAVECWKLVPHKRVFRFGHGCDVERHTNPDCEDYIVSLARIEKHKNQVNLAMACRELGRALVLVGDAPDRAYLNQATALGAVWANSLDRKSALDILSSAKIHALPSFSETPGMSNMEAACMGIPAVMGNIGAEPEFFGEGGIYVNPTDWRDIALGIEIARRREREPWANIPTWADVAREAVIWMKGQMR